MEIFTTRVKTNLDGVLQMAQTIDGIMMTGDNSANQILVELYRGSSRITIDPDTKIVGYFIRSDGETLEIDGEVTASNEAKVIIPEAAYQVSGALSIAIRLFSDPVTVVNPDTGVSYQSWDTKIVVAALNCFVQITETNSIIDIYHHIPDVQELLAYIEVLDTKRNEIDAEEAIRIAAENTRTDAESARVSNESIRVSNEATRVSNETVRDTAEAERASAEAIRISNEATRVSNETTRNTAESGRVSNEISRQNAESARDIAETARQDAEIQRATDAQTRFLAIDNMTVSATKQAIYSNPTVSISEVDGHKHIQFGLVPGDPFVIKKVFGSIFEMNAYEGTDIIPGQFAMITSYVEDPDNAKLYVKTDDGYSFVTDLSGAQGIVGPQGETGNGISSAELLSDYKLKLTYTDGTTYTTENTIRGPVGVGIASIVRNSDYTLTIILEDGSSYTTDPVKGEPGDQGTEFTLSNNDKDLTVTYF